MNRTLSTAAAAVLFAIAISVTTAAATTSETMRDELGIKRIKAVYPRQDSITEDTQPDIAVDASNLEAPLDPSTIVFTINGADMTSQAEIMPTYIIYIPPAPLAPGRYEVRVTGRDIADRQLEPVAWTFTIRGVEGGTAISKGGSNSTGRISVSTDYISADYTPNPIFDLSSFFREKEGMKLNADMSVSNVSSGGRTVDATFRRETQQYTDTELDKGRLQYTDSKFQASAGYFYLRYSDLTVLGTELAGARVDKAAGNWDLSMFAGRTQDPSTSGTFKQMAGGIRSRYSWNRYNSTSLTAISARENSDAFHGLSNTHSADEIIGVYHEYNNAGGIRATFEAASDKSVDRGCPAGCASDPSKKDASMRDYAYRSTINATWKQFSAGAEIYKIDDGFMPISEGGAGLLKNDRNGGLASIGWQVFKSLSMSGEFEDYETDSSGVRTKRGGANISYSNAGGMIQTVMINHSVLTVNGTEMKSTGANMVANIPNLGPFRNNHVTASLQNVTYDSQASSLETDTDSFSFSIVSSIGDGVAFSAGYSNNDNISFVSVPAASTESESRNIFSSVKWTILPNKLSLNLRYDNQSSTGTNVDNSEERMQTQFVYDFGPAYSLTGGYDIVSYSDELIGFYNYSQKIVRLGAEMRF